MRESLREALQTSLYGGQNGSKRGPCYRRGGGHGPTPVPCSSHFSTEGFWEVLFCFV